LVCANQFTDSEHEQDFKVCHKHMNWYALLGVSIQASRRMLTLMGLVMRSIWYKRMGMSVLWVLFVLFVLLVSLARPALLCQVTSWQTASTVGAVGAVGTVGTVNFACLVSLVSPVGLAGAARFAGLTGLTGLVDMAGIVSLTGFTDVEVLFSAVWRVGWTRLVRVILVCLCLSLNLLCGWPI